VGDRIKTQFINNNNTQMQYFKLMPAMQEEGNNEEEPTAQDRNKLFVDALGLNSNVLNLLNDATKPMGEVTEAFTNSFSELTKQNYLQDWEVNNKDQLTKTVQTGTHNALQSKLAKAFPFLNVSELQKMEKPTAAMIEAIKARHEELKQNGDSSAGQIQQLLDAANGKIEELSPELERLQAIEANIPNLKQELLKGFEDKLWIGNEIDKAIASIENINQGVQPQMIRTLLTNMVQIGVKTGEDGVKSYDLKDNNGKLLLKTPTSPYLKLSEIIKDKILVPNGLINQQNPPPAQDDSIPQQNSNGAVKGWPTGGMMGRK
jgi:hypothetical protein